MNATTQQQLDEQTVRILGNKNYLGKTIILSHRLDQVLNSFGNVLRH